MSTWTEYSFIIKPSELGGVGVFATHDIPKGTRVFPEKFTLRKLVFPEKSTSRKLKIKEVPADFDKYTIYINEEECLAPERFDHMEISWYMNHSDEPNIMEADDHYVIAVKDIKAGDEIVHDYNHLNEPEHLKEEYYKKA